LRLARWADMAGRLTQIAGFLVALIALVAAMYFWRIGLGFVLALATLWGLGRLVDTIVKRRAVMRFRAVHQRDNPRDLLIVYSNSPNWQRYIEQHWLPKWGDRAVLLNWSDRTLWQRQDPAVRLYRAYANSSPPFGREYNPLAIVVPARGHRVHVVRFWRAFRDYKHGKDRQLRHAEADLECLLRDRARR
jgi:hypothetical protein